MKSRSSEFECNICISDKLHTQGVHGVTYAQTIGNTEDFVGSALVEFAIALDSRRPEAKQTRAFREGLKSRGKKIPPIKKDGLRDELVILTGAGMSATYVVCALRKYIMEVGENGMWVGFYKDELLVERMDGTLEEASQGQSRIWTAQARHLPGVALVCVVRGRQRTQRWSFVQVRDGNYVIVCNIAP